MPISQSSDINTYGSSEDPYAYESVNVDNSVRYGSEPNTASKSTARGMRERSSTVYEVSYESSYLVPNDLIQMKITSPSGMVDECTYLVPISVDQGQNTESTSPSAAEEYYSSTIYPSDDFRFEDSISDKNRCDSVNTIYSEAYSEM